MIGYSPRNGGKGCKLTRHAGGRRKSARHHVGQSGAGWKAVYGKLEESPGNRRGPANRPARNGRQGRP